MEAVGQERDAEVVVVQCYGEEFCELDRGGPNLVAIRAGEDFALEG